MDEVEFLMCAFLFHLLFVLRGGELVPNKRDILQVRSLIHQFCFKKIEEKREFHKTAEKLMVHIDGPRSTPGRQA